MTVLPPMAVVNTKPVLDIQDAVFSFGNRQVLRGVNLAVRPGEVIALLGPNGAGKTTLVRAICGRIALDQGEICVAGHDVRRKVARLSTGIVPQEIALYPRLTGRENLETFAALSGVPGRGIRAAVSSALDAGALGPRADVIVSTLSGGWRRRFNVAAGILHHPRLLILDEPTAGVDLEARDAICATVSRLKNEGMAILLITHDFEQVHSLADRIGIMIDGCLVAEGRPSDLFGEYFGGGRHAYLSLRGPAGLLQKGELQMLGLVCASNGNVWAASAVDNYASAASLCACLEERGVFVDAVELRHPTVSELFALILSQQKRGAAEA